jgi:hypothetical protein
MDRITGKIRGLTPLLWFVANIGACLGYMVLFFFYLPHNELTLAVFILASIWLVIIGCIMTSKGR